MKRLSRRLLIIIVALLLVQLVVGVLVASADGPWGYYHGYCGYRYPTYYYPTYYPAYTSYWCCYQTYYYYPSYYGRYYYYGGYPR
jgi:heme A synthase